MKSCKEYRAQSKGMLSGNWGIAIAVSIVYYIITGALGGTFVGMLLLGGVLTIGYNVVFVNGFRKGKLEFMDLFEGFKGDALNNRIIMSVLMTLYIFLWSLLFVIPGIIAAYKYAMAPYLMYDHPEMTGSEALEASKKLMDGKKGKLFLLDLSYIGWILLGFVTLGIAWLFVEPWMQAAHAAFYEDIKGEVPGTATIVE